MQRARAAAAWPGGHATTLHPDLDLDECAERNAKLGRGARCGIDLFARIEAERDSRIPGQRCQPAKLPHVDNFVADQNVAHTAAHQCFGLSDFLATLTDGAGGDLLQRDGRAFVRLRMRTQRDAG
jgi:hypothetical protein